MDKLKGIGIKSEMFTLMELTKGIYAFIENEKGDTGSNAGIINLGDTVIVFDTFLNLDAAKEMKKLCLELTGRLPDYIINSHSHTDHILGNCLFHDGTKIISSKQTRNGIELFNKEFIQEKHIYADRVNEIDKMLHKATDKVELANLKNELSFVGNLAKPAVSIRIPDMIIDGEMSFCGKERSLMLKSYPAGHSLGDVIAYLPDDKICFTGDLLFVESHPWLGSGSPEQNTAVLEELLKYDIEYFVPGHGRIATKKDVELQIQYIREIINLVESKKMLRNPAFEASELSPDFDGWRDLCFQWNIEFLTKRNTIAQ